ncbi:MAG: glycosyltransferase [Gammaproteobacteria bacterium]|nr:glycosyltransferase [Gammaproteobacteria bacterium]
MTARSISVVIASGAGGDFLFHCLDSLRGQVAEQDAEVIVVDRCGGETLVRLEREYPFVSIVRAELDHRPSVPELRMLGVKEARGDIVAIIEEHCIAPPEWLRTIGNSFQNGDAAIGGPILDNDYKRVRDWVVYFSEYHNYLPPWPDGERYGLNGANIAYQRQKLLEHQNILGSGYWEVVLHPRLAKNGNLFRSVSGMGVYHTGPFDYGYYLVQRYLLSRVWGGSQRQKVSFAKRLVYLVAAPVFPFLLLGRIAQRVLKSGRRIGKFLTAVPLLIPVAVAYVWGEWLGYLLGVGNALEQVE